MTELDLAELARERHAYAEAEIELLLEQATALDWNNDAAAAALCVEQAEALATRRSPSARARCKRDSPRVAAII